MQGISLIKGDGNATSIANGTGISRILSIPRYRYQREPRSVIMTMTF